MKKILIMIGLILGIFYFQGNCSFPIRKAEELRMDNHFTYMKGKYISRDEWEDVSRERENYKLLKENLGSLGFEDRNNYYILALREGRIDVSEEGFLELLRERPKTREVFLNLIRLYYVLEEYNLAKSYTKEWVKKNRVPLAEFRSYLNQLDKELRWEERGMLLEAVSTSPGYELYSWQELGKYFLFQKDYESAEFYLQRVLETLPFHEESLVSMAELCIDSKRWSELVDYGKAMHLTPGKKKYSYFYIGKGYYERQKYQTCLKWLEKAPDSEKAQLDFLSLWRDALLAENPRNSLVPLRKYFRILKKEGLALSEEEFLPTLKPHGREVMDGFVR